VAAFLKIPHPGKPPAAQELEEYVAYAVEARRRVKEQMNKRKPDDEFARIYLSYFRADGSEVVVYCPESKDAPATQSPARRSLDAGSGRPVPQQAVEYEIPAQLPPAPSAQTTPAPSTVPDVDSRTELREQHFTILYGDAGYTYDSLIGPYLVGAKAVAIEDPYIRASHQVANLVRFCETVSKCPSVRQVTLITSYDEQTNLAELNERLEELKQSLVELDIVLDVRINENLHDREIRLDNGWIIKLGRGLDIYQKPDSRYAIGFSDFSLRKCLETKVDIFRVVA